VIAERAQIDTDEAFSRLRSYARGNNLRLADVSRDVANGSLTVDSFGGGRPTDPQADGTTSGDGLHQ
jgi:hypothetical protein